MNGLDHLLAFIDNGGRRSYLERRRNSKLARIPEKRRSKDRRIDDKRRKTQNIRLLTGSERRVVLVKYDAPHLVT